MGDASPRVRCCSDTLIHPRRNSFRRGKKRIKKQNSKDKVEAVETEGDGSLQATCICLASSTVPPGKRGLSARQTNSFPSSSAATLSDTILPVKVSVTSSCKTTQFYVHMEPGIYKYYSRIQQTEWDFFTKWNMSNILIHRYFIFFVFAFLF